MDVKASNGNWLINNAKPNTAEAPKLVSSSLTWEKIKSTNIGLDVAALNNRLTGSFDYFIRKTEDMMGPGIELPAALGTNVPPTNNTDMKTYGWELQIGWRDQIGDFKYGAKLSLSDSQSKILRYGNPTGSLSKYVEGELIGNIYGYTTIGIAKTDEEAAKKLAEMRKYQSQATVRSYQKMKADAEAGDPDAIKRYETTLAKRREEYHRKKGA
jgi:hypothetical protein